MIAGHYRLVEHIGSGAMGVVWRAVDERLERSVAIKQILAQPGLSEAERSNVRQRAMREAKNAARFQHPNAIVVFDVAIHDDDPCLVMEYLPSRSLSALLLEQPVLPLAQVARIGEQVAAALVAAHRAGIVHRDVKPGNILIDENGTTKITDFGISRAAGDLTLTQTGLIGGTPAYLAPELARGSDPAPASDVFSLGATLYHALEGQGPYGNSTNQLALLYTAANGQVVPPQQSGQATALLMNLLRSEPEERPSMAEARERLASIASGHAGSPGELVSPPLFLSGRQPAAPVGDGPPGAERPPWQRTERTGSGAPGTPPRMATATFAPPTPGRGFSPGTPASGFRTATPPGGMPQQGPKPAPTQALNHVRPPVPPGNRPSAPSPAGSGSAPRSNSGAAGAPGTSGASMDNRRKGIIAGSAAALLVVVGLVVFLVMNSGSDDQGGQADPVQPSSAAPSASAPPSSQDAAPAPAGLGKTPTSGRVEFAPAGQRLIAFYDFPASIASSWGMLTPAAQQVYGDQAAFQQYWGKYKSVGSSGARGSANDDGSANISVTVSYDGKNSRKTLRVVNSGGTLLIDSDTR